VSGALRKVALSDALELDRLGTRRAGLFDGISREVEEHLTWERVMRRMQWLELSFQFAQALLGRNTREGYPHCLDLIGSGRCLPRRHAMDDRSSPSPRVRYA
jgi:hypothetical protein